MTDPDRVDRAFEARRNGIRARDPAVVASRLDRTRRLLDGRVLVDASAWRLAREIADTNVEADGWGGEGLRGVWSPEGGPHGTTRFWAADLATHADACRLLGLPSGPPGADVGSFRSWEIEIPLLEDGTMPLSWTRGAETVADAVLADPRIGFDDGLLSRGGRTLVALGRRVRFADRVGPFDPEAARDAHRTAGKRAWTSAAAALERSGRGNGVPPAPAALAAAGDLLRSLRSRAFPPPPQVSVSPNGEIAFEWRGVGSYGRVEFRIGDRIVGRLVVANRARWSCDSPFGAWIDEDRLSSALQRIDRIHRPSLRTTPPPR